MEPASGPPRLAEACSPRIVEVADREHEIAAPTIRQAVEVLEALQSVAEGEFDDLQFLGRAVLTGWFPPDFMESFVGLPVPEQTAILRHLLFTGFDLPEPEGDAGGRAPNDDWGDLLAAYCTTYGGEPWRVYGTVPFPFFMLLCQRLGRTQARKNLAASEVAILPHAGKSSKSMMASMQRRAGYGPAARDFTEEDFARDRAALKALAGMMGAAQA